MNLDLISDIIVEGIDYDDAPDFVDAYIASANYGDRPLTDAELEELNDDSDFVHRALVNQLY